jgi:hypothetical protein
VFGSDDGCGKFALDAYFFRHYMLENDVIGKLSPERGVLKTHCR